MDYYIYADYSSIYDRRESSISPESASFYSIHLMKSDHFV